MRYEETSSLPVDRLLRGLRTARVSAVWGAARELRALGPDWVPLMRAELHTPDWTEAPRGRGDKVLGVLLALLDEFDHEAFQAEVERLLQRELHPQNRRVVALFAQRLSNRPADLLHRTVPVHVAEELGDPAPVLKMLRKWARRVGDDITRAAWIDIAPSQGQDDFSRYNALFSGVVLTWSGAGLSSGERRAAQYQPEYMLYRAVGHQIERPGKGIKFEDHERAADAYAMRLFRRAHPLYARRFLRDFGFGDLGA
ncbi:MAG: hypothetical protein KDK10_08130 [Maritimibacter sp.]|nr:hypothetical protein [Maritimibacter sp.]